MKFTEFIEGWLEHSPKPETYQVDALSHKGECAIFPLGDVVVSRKKNILGGAKVRRRFTMLLVTHHQRDPEQGDLEPYQRLQDVAEMFMKTWQDDPDITSWAEKAQMKSVSKEGQARYEMKLIFEYTTKG